LASRNGIRVNGKPIASSELKHGDVVSLGSVVLRIEWPSKDDVPVAEEDLTLPQRPSLLKKNLLPRLSLGLILLVCVFGVLMAVKQNINERKAAQGPVSGPTMTLHSAVASGNIDAIQENIRSGANINRQDEMGYTPLHLAALNGDTKIVRLLLENGANPQIKAFDGATPADIAQLRQHSEIAKLIREWKPKL
jgi:hypothetical protein